MTQVTIPEGMISVDAFCSLNAGMVIYDVIAKIKNGALSGIEIDGVWYVQPIKGVHNESEKQSTAVSKPTDASQNEHADYSSSKVFAAFLYGFGWLTIFIGLYLAFTGAVNAPSDYGYGSSVNILAALPGIGLSFSGLFFAALSQLITATIENATNTREIVSLLKRKN